MPDRQRGYVRRGEGILSPDEQAAEQYRRNANHRPAVEFDPAMQAVLVAAARALCQTKSWRLHQVMTDGSHTHTLISWRNFIAWKSARRSLRYRYTNELNGAFGNDGSWFSESGSRKRVRDRGHYDYLMDEYLPKHDGLYWRDDGKMREQCRAIRSQLRAKRRSQRANRKKKTGDQNHRL